MKKSVALILALIFALGGLGLVGSARAQRVRMWVKTPNGKTVNVRNSDFEIIGRLPYGADVIACDEEDDWTIIEYGSLGEGWIKSTFLVEYNPGKYQGSETDQKSKSKPKSDSKTPVLSDSSLGAQTVDGLNTQFKTMTYASAPYTVRVVPDTKTGTARLRWAPSKHATLAAYLSAGYELTVLASNKNWLMVRDESNGVIGYIAVKYTQTVQ